MSAKREPTVTDVLRRARRLLVTKGWIQGESAEDELGCAVRATSPRATCFCSIGAIDAAAMQLADGRLAIYDHLSANAKKAFRSTLPLGEGCIVDWNDAPGRKKKEVLARFKLAEVRSQLPAPCP